MLSHGIVCSYSCQTNTKWYLLIQKKSISARSIEGTNCNFVKLYPTKLTESPQRLIKLISGSVSATESVAIIAKFLLSQIY